MLKSCRGKSSSLNKKILPKTRNPEISFFVEQYNVSAQWNIDWIEQMPPEVVRFCYYNSLIHSFITILEDLERGTLHHKIKLNDF
jgi:hypothetical protein